MKRILSLVLIITMFLSFSSYAAPGDVAGDVLKTDIISFINGYPIRSFNINNSTAILVEDLKQYGFDVTWNGDERTVDITKNSLDEINPTRILYKNPTEISGEFECNYYETDIVTYIDGELVNSYNIGGKTAIPLANLKIYGEVSWNGEKREAHVNIPSLKTGVTKPVYTKYNSEYNAPMFENIGDFKQVEIADVSGFAYNISEISTEKFSEYINILRDCGFYYMEAKSKNDTAMYFTDDVTVVKIYYTENVLYTDDNLCIELSQAE